MTYRVTHTTAYVYESEVSASYGEAHLLPRDLPGQTVLDAELTIVPTPGQITQRLDYFGNRTHHFVLREGHSTLEVTATSLVAVNRPDVPAVREDQQRWESVREQLRTAGAADGPPDPQVLAATEFTYDSPQVSRSAAAAAYAVPSFGADVPVLQAVADLSRRIHRDFEFKLGATGVGTPVDQVIACRVGVCQDFAHLTIAALRSMGLAARYVSGYLETQAPPGQPKLQGSDVSHAWASVFVPHVGWVDVDPTNNQFVSNRYVVTAWGRDYGDVAPLKGVIFTDGETESLRVSVDVRRVSEAEMPGLAHQDHPVQQSQQQQQQTADILFEEL
ncbi:MAG: transglutaminase family protein [Euzebya sp.]